MSEGPKRIQRKRTRGWRMPPGAVYVGRPSRWRNPFRVGDELFVNVSGHRLSHEKAAGLFRAAIQFNPGLQRQVRHELRGRDLVCWCRLDQPCHADVLLEIANAPLTCEAADA